MASRAERRTTVSRERESSEAVNSMVDPAIFYNSNICDNNDTQYSTDSNIKNSIGPDNQHNIVSERPSSSQQWSWGTNASSSNSREYISSNSTDKSIKANFGSHDLIADGSNSSNNSIDVQSSVGSESFRNKGARASEDSSNSCDSDRARRLRASGKRQIVDGDKESIGRNLRASLKKKRSSQSLSQTSSGNRLEGRRIVRGGSRVSDSVVTGTLVSSDVEVDSNSSNNSSRIFGRSCDDSEEDKLSPVAGGDASGNRGGDRATMDINSKNNINNKYKHRTKQFLNFMHDSKVRRIEEYLNQFTTVKHLNNNEDNITHKQNTNKNSISTKTINIKTRLRQTRRHRIENTRVNSEQNYTS